MASTQSEPQSKITTNSEEPETHIVAITRCDDHRRVVPGHLLVKDGDTIIFQSIGAGDLVLTFPKPVFEKDQDGRIKIDEEGNSEALTVNAEPGCYPYVAFSTEACSFAEGGSEPKVIVRR
jgi:hypothetical protein